ncbi:hypothetical protein [Rhizobium phage RHph_X3_2]|nr:hypothetical protein [Rhizobium phage RHph_X3_2]
MDMKLATANIKANARKMLEALPPRTTDTLADIEQEGGEDYIYYGDKAVNPYMGAEGDAWARGFWTAKLEA